MLKITYNTGYTVGRLAPSFDTPEEAIAHLDRTYGVIYWEEDPDHPSYYDVAVKRGVTPVYSIGPIIEDTP